MKKRIKITLIVVAVLAVLVLVPVVVGGVLFGEIFAATNSVKKLENGLYSLEFVGDYGFDQFLERGGATNPDELAVYITEFLSRGFYKPTEPATESVERNFGCSYIYAKDKSAANAGGYVSGRNFDWYSECDVMIVHTVPKKGYESYSTCCLNFLGFGDDWKPEGFVNSLMSIAAIYVPLDGINEKGLVVADLMAGDKELTNQRTEKPDLTTTTAIRLMLDKAANVDEALALLEQYDMNSDIGSAHHYAISDATGRSVVVEYVNNVMYVTESDVLTNHYLCDSSKNINETDNSFERFEKLSSLNKNLDLEDAKNAIRSVSKQKNAVSNVITVWSLVYNQRAKKPFAEFYYMQDFENPIRLEL